MKLQLLTFVVFFSTQCRSQITSEILCDDLELLSNSNITSDCMSQLKIACNHPDLLWKMFDASSKYPITGMSYSNNRDLGNFDECLSINYEVDEVKVLGKYCGLSVAVPNLLLQPIPNPFSLEIKPKALAQVPSVNYSYQDYVALKDASPAVTVTILSLCVPDKCTPAEVGQFFLWGRFSALSLVVFSDTVPCMTKESNTTFRWRDILFLTVLSLVGCAIIACTTYDFIIQKQGKKPAHPGFLAFSYLTNGKKLLYINNNPSSEQIQCLNGMRFISMMWVIAGHGYVAIEQAPLINYAEIDDYQDRMNMQYLASGPIAVDTFFFLSGFVLTFGYLKAAVKLPLSKQIFGVPMMILHRYLRITPALAMLYFTVVTIYRFTGSGPLWDTIANLMNDQCLDNWWSFFLYVQNYVNFENMCLSHSWYLSADMQMFILAPLVLIPIASLIKVNKRNTAILGLSGLILVCVIFPMAIRFADHTIKNVYDSHSRFNNYLIGVLLGVIMRDPRLQKFPFSKLTNLTIWCFVLNICVVFNLIYHSILRVYDHTSDTLFFGLYRPVWCLSLAWMVYSCHHGYGGPINWLLSLPMFQIGARLSYCMYLLHAVVEMYYVGLIRTPYFWEDYMMFYIWCGHFVVTMLLSAIWSLSFESPMIVIEKLIFGGGGQKEKSKA